jgi:hypothetical protein
LSFHLRINGPAAEEGPFEVNRKNPIPLIQVELIKWHSGDPDFPENSGIINQDIYSAEALHSFSGHVLRAVGA